MPYDKLIHFLAGACIAAGFLPFGVPFAALAVLAAAVGREIWNDTGFDLADVVATLAGGAAMLAWLSVLAFFF